MARKRRKIGPIVGWTLFVVLIFLAGYFVRSYFEVGRLTRVNPHTTPLIEMRRLERGDKGAHAPLPDHWRPLSQISTHLQHAVIVAEDARFYQHHGFDWSAIVDAAERDWEAKSFEHGGSTITQQLAKNLYLSPDKNFFRKVKEALITSALEIRLSKRRILEVYLNVVEWGDQIYGAEAASRDYFGKPAAALLPEEAAFLAAILPAPRYYHRHRTTPYIRKRSEVILREMKRRYPESDPERVKGLKETPHFEREG